MKSLFITAQQAKQLGSDLVEYAKLKDTSDRELFKGFELRFGDLLSDKMMGDQSFELHPIPDYAEISKDS